MMFPQVLAPIQVRIIGAELNLALGLFGSMIGAGASPGQVIGRKLINADIAGPSWPPTFPASLPVGLAGLTATALVLRPTDRELEVAPDATVMR